MSQQGRGKTANGLLALSSAAVLAVYAAGYARTRSAADRFAVQAAVRRPASPAPAPAPQPIAITPAQPKAVEGPPVPPKRVKVKKPRPASQEAPVTAAVVVAEAPSAPPEPAPVVPAPPAEPPKPVYKDGTYFGWGTSRHGDIQAEVIIAEGRIASATIAQCYTRYSCAVIGWLPPQVAARQSPEVDYVSGATQSTNAFYYAVVEALAKAK